VEAGNQRFLRRFFYRCTFKVHTHCAHLKHTTPVLKCSNAPSLFIARLLAEVGTEGFCGGFFPCTFKVHTH
jgi:hypothetical protein